tara:strand:- start:169 stop:735 length:567 start_codon:yes stop_codon:yes gene_type:complete
MGTFPLRSDDSTTSTRRRELHATRTVGAAITAHSIQLVRLHLVDSRARDATQAASLGRRCARSPATARHAAQPSLHTTLSRPFVCVRAQTDDASSRIAALLGTQTEVLGVRIGVTNDWGSPSGFSYTLNFVQPGDLQKSDERIELADGAVLFVERKALWSGEGGLLGATLDLDENFNIIITKPDKNPT